MKTCLLCQDTFTNREVVGCFCSEQCAEKDWLANNVPKAFQQTDPARLPKREHFDLAMQWAWNRLEESGKPGLLLMGARSGDGKTRTGIACAATIARVGWHGAEEEPKREAKYRKRGEECGPAGLCRTLAQIKRENIALCGGDKAPEDRAIWLERMIHANVFMLDDISKVSPSDKLLETINDVLDTRLHEDRATILTSNLDGVALSRRWGTEFGPSLVRRLREFCETINFNEAGASNIVPLESEA